MRMTVSRRLPLVAALLWGAVPLRAQTDIGGGTANLSPLRETMAGLHDQPAPSPYDREIRLAYDLLGAGNLNEAYRHLNYAIKEDPDRAEAYLGFALAARARRRYAAAEKALRRALEVEPDHAGAHLDLASLWLLKRTPAAALEAIDRSIALSDGGDWKAHRIRGEALIALDRLEEAAVAYARSRALLRGRLKRVTRAIRREASREEVVEMHEETEFVVSIGGEVREVPVTRFDTLPKEVPAEWERVESRLQEHLRGVDARLAELAEWVEVPE